MAKKYIDAELLKEGLKELESIIHSDQLLGQSMDRYDRGQLHAINSIKELIDSLQQQTDGILNSYIEQRSKEFDAIIQEEMTPDNTVTIADKIGAMTAKNELLRIKELI